jgi:hypothetical protein
MTQHPNPSEKTKFWVLVGWFTVMGLVYWMFNIQGIRSLFS